MGSSEGSSIAVDDEGKAPGIKRELSVEDLFAPLNRLDVRHPSSSTAAADANPNPKFRVSASEDVQPTVYASPNSKSRASVFELHSAQPQSFNRPDAAPAAVADRDRFRNSNSSSASRSSSAFMAPIPEETGLVCPEKSNIHTPGFNMDCNAEEGPWGSGVALSKEQAHPKGTSMSKSLASISDTGLQMQGNSSSDEDQQVVDDRKQRRMLSNRESARRSRLRKQQHLDELRGHVAQLRAQNSQMLSNFNVASQQFAQITEENRQLRSEAMELSHQLQSLHHAVTSRRANNGLRHGADVRQVVQGPQY